MTTKLFVTAWRSDETHDVNVRRNLDFLEEVRDTIDDANNMPMTGVVGVWHGNVEESYCFEVGQLRQIDALKRLAWKYEQEAVLIVNAGDECVLHYANGTMECVGIWEEIDDDDRYEHDCYSVMNGKVYIAG